MGSILPPIWEFLSALKKDKLERERQGLNLYDLYFKVERRFNSMVCFKQDEEKKSIAEDYLSRIDSTLDELQSFNSEEVELLLRLRTHIVEKTGINNVDREYPFKVFRSERAYDFFKDVLDEFDMIVSEGKLKRGKQKYLNAIRESKLYQQHILEDDLSLNDYVSQINMLLKINLSRTNLSAYNNIDAKKVDDFLRDNFVIR